MDLGGLSNRTDPAADGEEAFRTLISSGMRAATRQRQSLPNRINHPFVAQNFANYKLRL